MNAKIWGAIAVALVLGACGAKQEEEAAPPATEEAAPAAEMPAEPTDPNAMPVDPAAPDAGMMTDPAAPAEETPPSQ